MVALLMGTGTQMGLSDRTFILPGKQQSEFETVDSTTGHHMDVIFFFQEEELK